MIKVYTNTVAEHEGLISYLIDDYDGRAEWFYSENAIQKLQFPYKIG